MRSSRKWTTAIGFVLAASGCYLSIPAPSGETGQISFSLQVGNIHVSAVNFTVQGAALSAPLQGHFSIHDDQTPPIWATIMDLSPGDYTIMMQALDAAGDALCTGGSDFTIVSGETAKVDLVLLCVVGDSLEEFGNADIDARLEVVEANRCPRLNYVGVIPDVIEDGGSADVEVLAQDSDGQTVHVTLSATEGTFLPASFDIVPPANGGLSTYTCTAPGAQTVTATVSDGDVLCQKTRSVDVLCGTDADLCVGVICNDDNDCTYDVCRETDGECIFSPREDGAACSDFAPSNGVCVDGTCHQFPPPITRTLPLVCSNSVTTEISELAYELTVQPFGAVIDGVPVEISVGGTAMLPPDFLNTAIAAIPGLTEVTLSAVHATPHLRFGADAAPADVAMLGPAGGAPQQVPLPLVSDPTICNLIEPPVMTCPSLCEDNTTQCNTAVDCAGIGNETCEGRIGLCECVADPILIPLASTVVTVIPNAGSDGDVLLGWNEDFLPPQVVVAADPAGPNGLRALALSVNFGLECWMGAVDDNGTPGDDTDDFPRQLLDNELISIPIE